MLSLSKLKVDIGGSRILDGISLSVGAGELVCLIGRNGAGKTTTFRTIMGYRRPRSGDITFDDTDLTKLPTWQIAQRGIGFAPEESSSPVMTLVPVRSGSGFDLSGNHPHHVAIPIRLRRRTGKHNLAPLQHIDTIGMVGNVMHIGFGHQRPFAHRPDGGYPFRDRWNDRRREAFEGLVEKQ